MVQVGGRVFQRFQMAPPGAEQALSGLLITHAGLEVVAQQVDALAAAGAEVQADATVGGGLLADCGTDQVDLVVDQGDLRRIRLLIEKLGPQANRVVGLWLAGIDHQQDAIGIGNRGHGTFDADLFNHVIGIAQAGGIDDMQRHAIDVDMFTQNIPGGAGDIRDDGAFSASQRVEQAGLAGIRPSGDDHRHAVTQQRALPCFPVHLSQLRLDRLQLTEYMAIGKKIDFLFRKINRRFDIDTQVNQGFGQPMHALGKSALQ